jgi:hypothetical protein
MRAHNPVVNEGFLLNYKNSFFVDGPRAYQEKTSAKSFATFHAHHLKIYRSEKGTEHFSLTITQHFHYFHQYIVAIRSSILEIRRPKSHDRLPSKFPG